MREYRQLVLRNVVGAEVRTLEHDGREHVVVPLVALIGDEVLWACNAEFPEFVPAAEVEACVEGWRGEPVVGDHPILSGERVSANLPEVLETQVFGFCVDPVFRDGRLCLEAWLDRERAETVGDDAVDVIRRAEANEPIEVSVGVFVTTEAREGVSPGGVHYFGVWRGILPDHLAMLPEGMLGACSNEMGCGAPRMNQLRAASQAGELVVNRLTGAGAVEIIQPRGALSEVVDVTPEQAQVWLDDAAPEYSNPVDEDRVAELAAAIEGGTFDYTTSEKPVAFDHLGHLADGEHRLSAIVKANTSTTLQIIQWRRAGEDQVPVVFLQRTEDRTMEERNTSARLRAFVSRVLSLVGPREAQTEDEMSDSDVRNVLRGALTLEHGDDFLWIESFFPAAHEVVFAIAVGDFDLALFRQGFAIDGDGVATLSGDAEEVRPVLGFEPVVTTSEGDTDNGGAATGEAFEIVAIERRGEDGSIVRAEFGTGGDCRCHTRINGAADGAGEGPMETFAERVDALIQATDNDYAESDRTWLEAVPEDRFAALEVATPAASDPPPATPEATPPAVPAAASDPVTPDGLEALVERRVEEALRTQQESGRRNALVASLATCQDAFSIDDLEAMSLDALEKYAEGLGLGTGPRAIDFAGAHPAERPGADEDVPAPPTLQEAHAKYSRPVLAARRPARAS